MMLLLLIISAYLAHSSSARPAFLIPSKPQQRPCPTSRRLVFAPASAEDSSANDSSFIAKDYFNEQASTKARALDVKVFRGFNDSAKEYVSAQLLLGNVISEKEATDLLMLNYNEDGSYMYTLPQYEPETYFVAIYNGTETDGEGNSSFSRQNGIVGVVSAQLRRRSPLIAGPSNSNGGNDDSSATTALPSVPLPSPHIYVANMRVEETMQRRGVAIALLSSVKEFANNLSNEKKIPLVLSVDNDNIAGVRLYEKFGFEYLEQNDVFRMLVLWP